MGPFETFNPAASDTGRHVPVVYVLNQGRIILNAAALRLVADTVWVQLLWDSDTKRIGIKPATEGDEAVFRLTRGDSQGVITSKAFVDTYLPPYKKRMKLAWDGEMWVASTTHPNSPLGSKSS